MTFASVYEMFDPLTTVRKQRFWDWFSGDDLHSRWTKSTNGSSTFAMDDSIDGGYKIYPGASNTNYAQIHFNNRHHFSETGSVLITVWKQASTNGGATTVGLLNTNTSWNTNFAGSRFWSASDTKFELRTADASTASESATSVDVDTNFHVMKYECGSSDVKMWIEGTLEVTKTTNRPTTRLQPFFMAWNENGNRDYAHIRYLETYNT